MIVKINETNDPRLGKFDAEGHRVQPQQDLMGNLFNPDSQGYTQFYFSRGGVQYFLQNPINSGLKEIVVEWETEAAPVVAAAPIAAEGNDVVVVPEEGGRRKRSTE